jgi:hypothetical protein
MSWTLYLLGLHPDVQVYNDLIAEFAGTRTQNITGPADIQEPSHAVQIVFLQGHLVA